MRFLSAIMKKTKCKKALGSDADAGAHLSEFYQKFLYYGRLVKKDHWGQAILKLPCPRHLFAPNGLPPGSFDDFLPTFADFSQRDRRRGYFVLQRYWRRDNFQNRLAPMIFFHQTTVVYGISDKIRINERQHRRHPIGFFGI